MWKTQRAWKGAITLAVAVLVAGCTVRSISNSGYPGGRGADNPLYQGELTEFDVLGIDLSRPISSAEISEEFRTYSRLTVKKGSAVMVIQSGAMIPDEPMLRELSRYFAATPFSGVPLRRPGLSAPRHAVDIAPTSPENYAMALRLAAAKGGYRTIYCYWGVIESAVENHATKAISWVPILGLAIPDETQQMRIRLKVAVVDVKSGRWSIFAPASFEDQTLSASLGRASSDQGQVALLKERAYKVAVADFVKAYAQ